MQTVTLEYKGYVITSNKELLQPEAIHRWLATESYWSRNIPFSMVKRAFDHSFCIGALKGDQQIAYARLVTDYTTFAYLADVYVEEAHRGQGISKKIVELLMEQDWVKGLRRIMLATLDAHDLYSRFGFAQPAFPERFMEINRPAIYEKNSKDH